jgi:arsenate reductase (thioredoxin)
MIQVLFLCTHNAARSQIAEGLLNHLGGDRFRAHSAGSAPRPDQRPHPLALRVLQEAGIPTDRLRSKPWDEFARPDAPRMDLVITLCDAAAGESCPLWPGHPVTAHWGFPDPSAVAGTDEQRLRAFREVLEAIRRRIESLLRLPVDRLEPTALQSAVRRLAGEES